MKLLCIICSLLLGPFILAQEAFVIKDVTLFDGEQIIEKTSVLIEGSTIQEIGKRLKGKYIEIDGKGKFLMPALTNSHVHCWGQPQLLEAAKAGVLNLLDMHGLENMQNYLVKAGEQAGNARFFRAGYAATAKEGHGTQYGFPVPTVEAPEDAESWIKDRVEAGVDYIKIIYEPWKNTHNVETVKALVQEAHKNEKKAVVHISNGKNAYEAYEAGADGLVHLWRDFEVTDSQLKEMASRSFFITPTMLTNIEMSRTLGKRSDTKIAELETKTMKEIKRVYDAGIPLLAGTDPPNGNINMGTDLYKELIYFSKAGIPNIDVLKTATSLPAKYYNLKDAGHLKVGGRADMILLEKNPLEDMNNLYTLETVWKEGVVVNRD